MKKISERTEKFITLELSESQLVALAISLGLTNADERTSEARSFYQIPNYVDTGEDLFDSLAKVLGMTEYFEMKKPESPESSDLNINGFKGF